MSGSAWGVMGLLVMVCGTAGTCAGGQKSESSGPWCFQVLLYGCETWTLTKDLRRRLNSFGTSSLRTILGYRCSYFVSNERLLKEVQMSFVTCIVREHQLRLHGQVGHFSDGDPAHQILSAREPHGWRSSRLVVVGS